MKTSRYIIAILFCLAAILTIQGQSGKARESLLEAKKQVHEGDLKANKEQLTKARSLMEGLTADKSIAALAHYYAGFASWRLSVMESDEARLKEMEKAVEHLSKSIEFDKDFAEAYALLSSCSAQHPKYRGAPEYNGLLDNALKLAPQNPRVMLFQAMSLFYRPEQYGGDKAQGIKLWQDAARLSEPQQKQDALLPDWGRAEIVGWLGGAYLSMNEPQKAKEAFEKSLAVYPDFWWVKTVALPRAEDQLRDKK